MRKFCPYDFLALKKGAKACDQGCNVLKDYVMQEFMSVSNVYLRHSVETLHEHKDRYYNRRHQRNRPRGYH